MDSCSLNHASWRLFRVADETAGVLDRPPLNVCSERPELGRPTEDEFLAPSGHPTPTRVGRGTAG